MTNDTQLRNTRPIWSKLNT